MKVKDKTREDIKTLLLSRAAEAPDSDSENLTSSLKGFLNQLEKKDERNGIPACIKSCYDEALELIPKYDSFQIQKLRLIAECTAKTLGVPNEFRSRLSNPASSTRPSVSI